MLCRLPTDRVLSLLAAFPKPTGDMVSYIVKAAAKGANFNLISEDEATSIGTEIIRAIKDGNFSAPIQGEATVAVCSLGLRNENALVNFSEAGAGELIAKVLPLFDLKDKSTHTQADSALKFVDLLSTAHFKENAITSDKMPLLESLHGISDKAGTHKKIRDVSPPTFEQNLSRSYPANALPTSSQMRNL